MEGAGLDVLSVALVAVTDHLDYATSARVDQDQVVTVADPPLEAVGRTQVVRAIITDVVTRAEERRLQPEAGADRAITPTTVRRDIGDPDPLSVVADSLANVMTNFLANLAAFVPVLGAGCARDCGCSY